MALTQFFCGGCSKLWALQMQGSFTTYFASEMGGLGAGLALMTSVDKQFHIGGGRSSEMPVVNLNPSLATEGHNLAMLEGHSTSYVSGVTQFVVRTCKANKESSNRPLGRHFNSVCWIVVFF